jgi:hypothetical protein
VDGLSSPALARAIPRHHLISAGFGCVYRLENGIGSTFITVSDDLLEQAERV